MNDTTNLIYKETFQRKPFNGIKAFLLIVGLVFGCLGLLLLIGFVQYCLQRFYGITIGYLQFFLLGGAVVGCFFLVKYYLTNYDYYILKDSICIVRTVGKREKIIAQFTYESINYFGKFTDKVSPMLSGRKKEVATFKKISEDTYCFVIKDRYILLDVTDEFIKKYEETK